MCFGCSKEPSHRAGSFEYPHHMFLSRNNKNQLRILIWGPGQSLSHIRAGISNDRKLINSINLPEFGYFVESHSQLTQFLVCSVVKKFKVRKKVNIRNRNNQVPHPTQDTLWESDKYTRKRHTQESQKINPFPACHRQDI